MYEEHEYLTPTEAGELLRVNRLTIIRLIERGDISGFKVGRQWRVRRADLIPNESPAE